MERIRKKHFYRYRGSDNSRDSDRSRLNKVAFVLLFATPVIATLLFGSADIPATGVLSILAAALVLILSAESWKAKRFIYDSNPLQIPLAGMVVIGIVQLLPFGSAGLPVGTLGGGAANSLSLDPYATRFFVIRLIVLLIFFAASLILIDSRRRMRTSASAIVIFGAAVAFFGILQRLSSPEAIYWIRNTPQSIAFGPFVNQHHFAAFMEMTCGLTLALLIGGATKKDKRSLLILALALMVIAVIFTGSRGGMLSLGATFAIVLGFGFIGRREGGHKYPSSSSRLAVVAGIVVFIFVAAASVIYLGGGDQLIRGVGLNYASGDVTSGRMHFWAVAWQIFLAHPLIGAGFDAFGVAFTRYDTWNGIFRVEQAHNDYLQILADAGILGFACVAAFIYLLYKRGIAVIRSSSNAFRHSAAIGSLAGCTGVLIHSFFDFPLRTPSNAFFLLLLAVLATASIRAEH